MKYSGLTKIIENDNINEEGEKNVCTFYGYRY